MLNEHLSGVRLGEDVECIHRARVASRRLRAVLAMFGDCWKPKLVKGWKRQIRQLARDLGEARDRDVQIEFLVATLASVSDPVLVPGIVRLLSHFEQQRQWLQPQVLRAVEQIERSGALKEMQASARRVLDRADSPAGITDTCLLRRATKAVRRRLQPLLANASGLKNPRQYDRHHAMRIAAKRLRYTLELAQPRHSPEFTAIMEAIKKLQTLLGEMHDCDVWAADLDAFASSDAKQTRVFFGDSRRFNRILPGLVYLRQDRKTRRDQAFTELVAYWEELLEKRLWKRLIKLLKSDAAMGRLGSA